MNRPSTIELFGGLCVKQGDQTIARFRTQKTAVLLAYLACFLRRTHPREELVELLWPDTDIESGRTSLRTALASLRRQLEPPGTPENSVLVADRANVRLNPDVVSTDVAAFETALRAAKHTEDPAERTAHLTRAVERYRGPLLPGFYEDWALRERERLEQLFIGASRDLALALEQSGDFSRAIDYAHRAVTADPLSEEAHAYLIHLYAAAGQPAAAQRQYAELKRILHKELGEVPSPATQALVERLLQEPRASTLRSTPTASQSQPLSPSMPTAPRALSLAPLEGIGSPQPRLPLQLTRFFGRKEEIARLEQIFGSGETRLLTLTGPGGSGKTRLALEAARRLTETFEGRVYFAPLADITDPRLIAGTLLEALGVQPAAEVEPLAQVAGALAGRPALLILDNFEQVAEEGAQVVWTLLERVPTLACLVTSRHRLDIGGEREFPVPPLPVPSMPGAPERLATYPSVRLFVDRAQAARPDFQITRDNAATVAALCERLEGIPLAIELAAAWVGTLTVAQILARLEHRFDLLTSRRKDLSPRHRTLRAAIEWSYRLLPAELQRFFARLSVFQGGWTLEAAEAVCEEPQALEFLQQLRERSLALSEETAYGMRFRLLESIRDYAQEQLTEEEKEALKARHLDFFLQFAAEARWRLHGPEQEMWLERIEQYHDNIRAALQWSRETPGRAAEGLRLASYLHFFWYVRGHLAEGYRWITDLLAHWRASGTAQEWIDPSEAALLQAEALQGAGELAFAQGDLGAARACFEQTLAHWRAPDERKGIAYALCYLGIVIEAQGEAKQAQPLFDESLAIWREMDDKGGIAHTLKCLGANARVQGNPQRAQSLFEEGLGLYRELGNRRGINMMLGEMAHLLIWQGEYRRAETLLQECLLLSEELKDMGHTTITLWNLGDVARCQGDYVAARAFYEQSLAIVRELGDRRGVATTLNCLGLIAMEQGDYTAAYALYEEGLTLVRELGEKESLASLLNNKGRAFQNQGDYAAAHALYEESLEIYRELGNMWGIATMLRTLGNLTTDQGDYAAARAFYQQSLAIARELGDKHGISMALYDLGDIAWQQGDAQKARTLWEQSCALDQELGIKGGSVLGALGTLATQRGDYEEARRLWGQSLAEHQEIGDRKGVAESLEGLAALAAAQTQPERAARLYGAAEAIRDALGSPVPSNERAEYERSLAALRSALGEKSFAAAWAQGRKLPLEQAVSHALASG